MLEKTNCTPHNKWSIIVVYTHLLCVLSTIGTTGADGGEQVKANIYTATYANNTADGTNTHTHTQLCITTNVIICS